MAASPESAPATKAARHALISHILTKTAIHSQQELKNALADHGITTTQATLSRDLVELRATKVRIPDGGLVYAVPEAGAPGQRLSPDIYPRVPGQQGSGGAGEDDFSAHTTARLTRWCTELLVTAEYAGSNIVMRTPAGAAQLLASSLDDAMMPGVLGCIAGDDTVLVITRDADTASSLTQHLLSVAETHNR